MARQQLDHKGKERRLGAAEVVGPVTVRDMAPGINLVGEVRYHILHFIPVATFGQAEHGKVAVPIVDLAETAARHHVRLRQRQERIPLVGAVGGAGQHRPQAIDMLAQRLPGRRNVLLVLSRQGKVHLDKVAQIEARLVTLHPVVGQDHVGIAFRYGIGEGFLIGEELSGLHVGKQRTQQDIRRLRRGLALSFGGQRLCGSQREKCAPQCQLHGKKQRPGLAR